MAMSISRAARQAPPGPVVNSGFRKAEPLAEAPRALPEKEVSGVFSAFFPRKGPEMAMRYSEAREALCSQFGACAEIVETPNEGLRFRARLEFLTEHRALDADLNQRVSGEGFELRFCSQPVTSGSFEERYELRERPASGGGTVTFNEPRTIRSYVISTAGRTSQVDKAADSAEALLRLAVALRPAGMTEDLPANVVPLDAARASRPPLRSAQPPQDSSSPEAQLQEDGGRAS
jgi:hypothetical protein